MIVAIIWFLERNSANNTNKPISFALLCSSFDVVIVMLKIHNEYKNNHLFCAQAQARIDTLSFRLCFGKNRKDAAQIIERPNIPHTRCVYCSCHVQCQKVKMDPGYRFSGVAFKTHE